MKLSMPLVYAGNPRETADQVVGLEKAGLDLIWVAEPYGFDAPTLMGYLAAKTETVQIGAGILNVYSRTPGALLQTAAGIEGFHGLPYDRPLTRTREVIDVLRMGLRHERLDYQGKTFSVPLPEGQGLGLGKPLKLLNKPERPSVPLWVAALGDKNVAMTAEVADGWLPFLYYPEKAQQVWGEPLARGAAKRSADLAPLEICAGGMVAIGEGPETKALLDFMRPMYALYVGGMGARDKNFYNQLACEYGFEKEAKEIQDLYLSGKKKEAEALVPLEWLEAGNLVGPESYVKERIAAFKESGVTHLSVTPASDDPAGTIAQIKEWVS